jgi:xanthine/uracil permease
VPPAAPWLLLAVQHVLMMYADAVAVPLIVGGALHLSRTDTAFLVSADLFCCGLATLMTTTSV